MWGWYSFSFRLVIRCFRDQSGTIMFYSAAADQVFSLTCRLEEGHPSFHLHDVWLCLQKFAQVSAGEMPPKSKVTTLLPLRGFTAVHGQLPALFGLFCLMIKIINRLTICYYFNVKANRLLYKFRFDIWWRGFYYQNHHGVVQRAVGVQSLHVVLDDVVPLHTQVNEAPGLDVLSLSVEDVMPGRLVLDCCNQSRSKSFTHKKSHWRGEIFVCLNKPPHTVKITRVARCFSAASYTCDRFKFTPQATV